MRKNQTLISIVNTIFDELNQTACITLEYRLFNRRGAEALRICSINGHPDGISFTTWLKDACDRATWQFFAELAELSFQEKELAGKYAINRCRRLGAIPGRVDLEEVNPKFLLLRTKDGCSQEFHSLIALRFAGRYFIIRHHLLRELASRIRLISLNYLFCSQDQDHIKGQVGLSRLTTTFTVQMLAGFARILYESGFFKDTSKLMVCRRFAGLFSTPRQKEISFKSFANQFNMPDQPSMPQLVENLGKWMKNAEKIMDPEMDT